MTIHLQTLPIFILWDVALVIYVLASAVAGTFTGRIYVGPAWGTFARSKQPVLFWFNVFLQLAIAAGLGLWVIWAVTGMQPAEAIAGVTRRLFPG